MTGRREVIKAGLAAVAGASVASVWAAEKSKDKPKPQPQGALVNKSIPSSGERLAVVGLGTNNYSPASAEERAARREVVAGLTAAGAQVIDTAPGYRQSEETLGGLIADIGNRKQVFLATKITAPKNDLAAGKAMFEESRRRLKADVIDLLQIHSLDGVDVLFPYMNELKRNGQVRYIGITTSNSNQHESMVELIKTQPLDFVQVDYSLANRDAADTVLPAALAKRVGVLINMPFGGRRDGNLIRRMADRPLPDWAADIDATSWGQVFLKYVVSHPAVTVAIPGMTKISHLEDNLQAIRGRLPDAAMRTRIEKFWDANFGEA
jgi:aryl-alcohol dehydrogenase-like predicted oxidoreductase